jgi:hypothetical protein
MDGEGQLRRKNRPGRNLKEKGKQKPEKGEAFGKLNSRRLRIGLAVAFSCLLIFSVSLLMWNRPTPSPQTDKQPQTEVVADTQRALILDGLYVTSPNTTFSQTLRSCLSSAGFKVDVVQGENVTIDVLRNVAGYRVLILRLHSAVHSDGFLYLFSGERYSQLRYSVEQLSRSVRKGVTFEGDEFFAINAVLLGGNKPSGLNGSTIILMGCNGTCNAYSVRRLLEKGVNAYIGWNGYVDLSHSDQATLTLVRHLYVEWMTVKESVEGVMLEMGPDPLYNTVLEYQVG